MSFLDSAIEWASPTWGMQRKMSRMAMQNLGRVERWTGYREANPTPRDGKVFARGASPDWALEMGQDRRQMVDVARQLERTNSIAGNVLDRACQHVVGEGLTLKCKTDDEGWNRGTEEWWNNWCCNGADARGQMTLNQMLTIVYRSWLRDGDVGVLLNSDGTIRLVESDEIASKMGGYNRPSDADGVELDRNGRIIAFYIFDYDPSVLWSDRRNAISRLIRIPASDMIFLARRLRAGQSRGISAFAGVSWMFESLDDILESVAVALHMAAAAGLVIEKDNPIPGTPLPHGGEIKMGPGKIMRIAKGEKIYQVQPQQPGNTFDTLRTTLTRVCAARFGQSLELVNYDFTDANYSNMRAQSLETALAARIQQRGEITQLCTKLFGWKLLNAIRTGERPARKDALKHAWGVSGTPWQDPEVELRAGMGSVDACLDTRRHILARRGLDFDEVVDEVAKENEKMRKAGIADIRSNLTRDAVPTTRTISDTTDEPAP